MNEYNENMYLSSNDLNNIEHRIETLTNQVQENIFNNTQSPLRNIQVGDDLSGKTLYLSFPRASYLDIENSEKIDIIKIDDSKFIAQLYWAGYDSKFIYVNYNSNFYYLYAKDTEDDSGNPFLNNIRFKLPDNFGIVTEINSENEFYQYIKIYDDETIIPNYVRKEWIINELPYIQYIDNIEHGIENLGNYFTKPVGWITPKEWLETNSITSRVDYNIGSKTFSYKDINRWIHNLELLENEDMVDCTIWNTDKTEYNWHGHSEIIDYDVQYNDSNIQYDGVDIIYKYWD